MIGESPYATPWDSCALQASGDGRLFPETDHLSRQPRRRKIGANQEDALGGVLGGGVACDGVTGSVASAQRSCSSLAACIFLYPRYPAAPTRAASKTFFISGRLRSSSRPNCTQPCAASGRGSAARSPERVTVPARVSVQEPTTPTFVTVMRQRRGCHHCRSLAAWVPAAGHLALVVPA
jgi:hypothetical protein